MQNWVRSAPSDQPLIEALREAGGDASFSDLAADIVVSRQFRNRRIEEADLVASAHNRNAPVQTPGRKGEE